MSKGEIAALALAMTSLTIFKDKMKHIPKA